MVSVRRGRAGETLMLHTQLHFYPDARRPDSIRLGALLFSKGANGAFYFSHYLDHNAIESSEGRTDSEMLRAMLRDLGGYLVRQLKGIKLSHPTTEEEFALQFVSLLPQNLRVAEFIDWPPESFQQFLEQITNEEDKVETRRVAEQMAAF